MRLTINITFGPKGVFYSGTGGDDTTLVPRSREISKEELSFPSLSEGERFFSACVNGKLEEVKRLLTDTSLKYKDKNNQTPFFVACEKGYFEIVKELLKLNEKIDVNEPNNNGETPFYMACWIGQTEVVKLLLNVERVDVNKKDKNGMTPFLVSCEKGHIEIVKLLLNDSRIDINKGDKNGQPPLLVACQKEQKEVVKILLNDERVEREKKKEYGAPFYVTCLSEKFEIVQHFFVNEKDPRRIDNNIEKVNEDKNPRRIDITEKMKESNGLDTVILPPTRQATILSKTKEVNLPPETLLSNSKNNSDRILEMHSLNNTFEKRSFKELDFPLVLGRGKNSTKGLFDSQVISRNHAEIVFMKNKVLISSPFSLV